MLGSAIYSIPLLGTSDEVKPTISQPECVYCIQFDYSKDHSHQFIMIIYYILLQNNNKTRLVLILLPTKLLGFNDDVLYFLVITFHKTDMI